MHEICGRHRENEKRHNEKQLLLTFFSDGHWRHPREANFVFYMRNINLLLERTLCREDYQRIKNVRCRSEWKYVSAKWNDSSCICICRNQNEKRRSQWKYVRCNLLLIFFCDGCSRGPGTTALLELDAVDHTIVDHTLIDHTLDDHTVVDHILVDHTDICTFQTCQMQLLSHVWIFFRAGRPIKTVVWYGCL